MTGLPPGMPRVKQASKQKRATKAAAVTVLGATGLGFSLLGNASASTMCPDRSLVRAAFRHWHRQTLSNLTQLSTHWSAQVDGRAPSKIRARRLSIAMSQLLVSSASDWISASLHTERATPLPKVA